MNVTIPARESEDALAAAEAARIRALTEAETEAARVKAAAEAEAIRIKAAAEAEKLELANRRAAMKLEADQAAHAKRLAETRAQQAAAEAAAEKTRKESLAETQKESDRAAEQKRSERLWKWGARGIYGVGLVIAAPVQFLDFWDKKRPFLVAAPILLEGLALVLACGAAWAVAHRRDVMPYRIGIMFGALIAATINMRGGLTNPAIGFNSGLIGAIASLGGPIVLMAYEHGIAQKADGIPSLRERRAEAKAKAAAAAVKEQARKEKEQAARQADAEKKAREEAARLEQQRRDNDRSQGHPEVWAVAEAMRSARGSEFVTEQIWGDAWYRVTGSKVVGITPEIEGRSRAAQAQMKAASDGALPQVDSQKPVRAERDPDAPDGRRFNGGTPPLRRPGDTTPYSLAARQAMADTARHAATAEPALEA